MILAHVYFRLRWFIVSCFTFAAAYLNEFDMSWTQYRRRSIEHMSAYYETSIKPIGNLPVVFFNVSL